ncbi:hypothetical protein RCO27_11075 [Sphingosinicella sp. LHD-64]|uniref:hypothetical protein n=1 Tax=Sphingosinicella sp. LHD-64 TaxID=3072139 RepID=UPI00280F1B28|nr:hypothetical protein [Sphingosinicella sp. LHD-64]MDQ8756770.1 hypothetical protein [Sphingosinicella sp. LHD-64]
MNKLLIACVFAALAAPASAQDLHDGDLTRNLPSSRDVEAMAPAIDRMAGALMTVDVGPMMDAVDPLARHPGYGVPGRTLGALGRHNDPYFDERVRGAIYGGTAQAGAMMDAFAAMLPALQRSLDEVQRGIGDAVDQYHRRGYASDRGYDDDGPWYED